MKTENKILMAQAREALDGKWWLGVQFALVFCAITAVVGLVPFGPLLISGPLYVGSAYVFLRIARKQENPLISDIFCGFNRFVNGFVAYLLVGIFIILWSLLFIVPGIMAALSYSQTFRILSEDSVISAQDAIEKSKKMMCGNRWKYFCLGLRFFWWVFLALCTFGIGFFWLIPYMQVTFAKFYDDIKANPVEVVTPKQIEDVTSSTPETEGAVK